MACEAFGECLEFGWGVSIDLQMACEYYRRAAAFGYPIGALNYGLCLEYGKGIEINCSLAVEYYRFASTKCGRAMSELGRCLENGIGISLDYEKALECYEKASALGEFRGRLGYSALRRRIVAESVKKPLSMPSPSECPGIEPDVHSPRTSHSEFNDAESMTLPIHSASADPGVSTEESRPVVIDSPSADSGVSTEESKPIVIHSSGATHIDADALIVQALSLQGGSGAGTDLAESVQIFKLAADHNHPTAQFHLGLCLRQGRGLVRDPIEAVRYFKLAADQGDSAGQFHYGVCLRDGCGVGMDVAKSAKYFKSAVSHVSNPGRVSESLKGTLEAGKCYEIARAGALYAYGSCLEFGHGIPKNAKVAGDFYRAAASSGHAEAQASYGFCCQHRLCEEADNETPIDYYAKSADQNDPGGAFLSAVSVQYELGAECDLDEAMQYYELSGTGPSTPLSGNSFRCGRACGKASFPIRKAQQSEISSRDVLHFCLASRPFRSSLEVTDYIMPPVNTAHPEIIGYGGSSIVARATDRVTKQAFAVKHLSPTAYDDHLFLREVEALVHLNHPCVQRILGWSPPSQSTTAQIRTELAENKSLEHVLNQARGRSGSGFLAPTARAIIICGIVLGMRYVHRTGFVHRDLKPLNILMNGRDYAMIGDFGSCWRENDGDSLTSETGTVFYAAPERFSVNSTSTQSDVFSFGTVLYEIVTGRPAFPKSLAPLPVVRMLRSGTMPEVPDACGDLMQEVIRRCWSMSPESRPSFDEILKSFLSRGFAMLPGADASRIANYVRGVEDWEFMMRESDSCVLCQK
jgi:TPR repeat protein